MTRGVCVLLALGAVSFSLSAAAEPNRWDAVRDPRAARAQQLLDAADRARIPADPELEGGVLSEKLNERSALMIRMAGGDELGDTRLLYLLGDCLVHASGDHRAEGQKVLLRALREDPDSPQAARAWFLVGTTAVQQNDPALAHQAYSAALELQWEQEARSMVLLNRAKTSMAAGDLAAAIADYRASLRGTKSLDGIALGKWGLAIALDRSLDFPSALSLAAEAAQMGFGPNGNKVAIDLEGVFFEPKSEIHYYRALSLMGLAASKGLDSKRYVEVLQTAELLWLTYLQAAPSDGPWVARARQHLRWIKQELSPRVTGTD